MQFGHSLATPPYLASSPHRFLSSSLVALYEAVLAGAGICLLPSYLIRPDTDLRRILPDEVMMTRQIWMTVHSDLRDIAGYRAVRLEGGEGGKGGVSKLRGGGVPKESNKKK